MTTEIKNKRGRPPLLQADFLKLMRNQFPEVTTRRGQLNKFWEFNGLRVIHQMVTDDMAGLKFLDNPDQQRFAGGIVRELGRISDDESIKKVAFAICEAEKKGHRTIRQYEALLRDCRLSNIPYEYWPAVFLETVSENGNQQKSLEINLPRHVYEALEEWAKNTLNERTVPTIFQNYDNLGLYVSDLLEAFIAGRYEAKRLLYDAEKVTKAARHLKTRGKQRCAAFHA